MKGFSGFKGFGKLSERKSSGGSGPPPLDPLITAFIALWSISNSTEINAYTNLLDNLRGDGSTPNGTDVFSKMLTIWPISPTSAAATQGDLLGNFDMTANGLITFAASGVKNNVAGYYNTGYNPFSQGKTSLGCTVSNKGTSGSGDFISGVVSTSERFILRQTSPTNRFQGYNSSSPITGTGGGTTGIITGQVITGTGKDIWENDTKTSNSISGGTSPNLNLYFMCQNQGGVASTFCPTTLEFDFSCMHDPLTNNERADLKYSIIAFNTELGR